MKPEERLHLLAPYLPTDRFRALLRNLDLPLTAQGAALLIDIVGFTPMTTELVTRYEGRAGEELRRRINPMFELIAGQVFQYGGSVIRFLGDGFMAWFDDAQAPADGSNPIPAALRAACAGVEMQDVMRLYRALRLKVCIGVGTALRYVVGQPIYGLADVIAGPAVEAMLSLIGEAQPEQVVVHRQAVPLLRGGGIQMEISDSGSAVVVSIPETLLKDARHHRWSAWAAEGDINTILNRVHPYVDASIRERVEGGIGDFSDELRNALPMFIQVNVSSGAPDAQAVLNAYVREVQERIAVFGGRLMSVEVSDKGSVLFVVFGAPVAYGDDAERALRFAITLREMVRGMPDIESQRMGVSRGLLYAGTVGGEVRHEYSTIGDETNIAARLMTAAQPGQILATSAVRKASGSRIVFKELQPIQVKGRGEPIPIFEPITSRVISTRSGRERGFVGREVELGFLQRAAGAVREEHPRIVTLEGGEGIGKTELINAFVGGLQEVRVGRGECISIGISTAYLPWQSLLYSLFGWNQESSLVRSAEALEEQIRTLLPDSVQRFPLLSDVLELPLDDTQATVALEGLTRREAIFALITEILLKISRSEPLILIFEDVQWIDEVSSLLIIDLVRRLSVAPAAVMVILSHRPLGEQETPRHLIQALAQTHFYYALSLGEFDQEHIRMQIERHLNAQVEPAIASFIYERTQGNPFFAREMIDALIESSQMEVSGQQTQLVRPLDEAQLPQTVREMVQARIDRLGELDKLVLKVAAVIGREFSMIVLADSLPLSMNTSDLLQRLDVLEAGDFTYLSSAEPVPVYRFRHGITQEVAYQGLLQGQREMLHRAVAAALRKAEPDAYEQLAHHFWLGRDSDQAWQYMILAGQKAYREYANHAALRYFSRALDISHDDEERFEIGCQLVQVLLRLGDTENARQRLIRMGQIAADVHRPDWTAMMHFFWSSYYTQISALPDALREAQQAINLAETTGDESLAWESYMLLRGALISLNQRDQVVRSNLDLKIQRLADHLHDTRHVIGLLLTQFDDMYAENPEMSIQGALTALAKAEQAQNPVLEAECWSVLVDLYVREGTFTAAYDAAEKQCKLLQQIGDRRREALTLNRMARLLLGLGQTTAANDLLQDAFQILHQIGERAGKAMNLLYLGLIADMRLAYDESLAYINRALVTQLELSAQIESALTLFHKGNVLFHKGNVDEAFEAFEGAAVIIDNHQRVRYALTRIELDCALAAIDLARGHYATARVRLTPMIIRLGRRQISGLVDPILAYHRVITVLDKVREVEQSAALRESYKAIITPTLEWLRKRDWEQNFIQYVRHHQGLMP